MQQLDKADDARKSLKMSRSTLYRLPDSTPGIYRIGRAKRFCVAELMTWARQQAMRKAAQRHD